MSEVAEAINAMNSKLELKLLQDLVYTRLGAVKTRLYLLAQGPIFFSPNGPVTVPGNAEGVLISIGTSNNAARLLCLKHLYEFLLEKIERRLLIATEE